MQAQSADEDPDPEVRVSLTEDEMGALRAYVQRNCDRGDRSLQAILWVELERLKRRVERLENEAALARNEQTAGCSHDE